MVVSFFSNNAGDLDGAARRRPNHRLSKMKSKESLIPYTPDAGCRRQFLVDFHANKLHTAPAL